MAGNKRKGRGSDDKAKGKKIAKIGQPSVSFHPLMMNLSLCDPPPHLPNHVNSVSFADIHFS